MNFRKRFNLALNLLFNQKASPYNFQLTNNLSQYQRRDDKYAVYAKEGFLQNPIVYAALTYKAQATSSAPLRAYTHDVDNPEALPRDHPAQIIAETPNPNMTGQQLQQARSIYLNISGNSYIYIDRHIDGTILGLYPLRPDRVRLIEMGKNRIDYYYLPKGASIDKGVPILAENMIHDKLPNPLDEYEGLGEGVSPLSAASYTIDVDNKFSMLLNVLVENGVMPAGVLSSDQMLTPNDSQRIRDLWRERYGGIFNWGDVAVLGSGTTYQRIGMTLEEMTSKDLDHRQESRILMVTRVPPILVGANVGLERATYANAAQARESFWKDVMIYDLRDFADTYNLRLKTDDYMYMHDLSKVLELQGDMHIKAQAAQTLHSIGVPLNIAVRAVGIDLEEIEGGDISYVSSLVSPVTDKDDVEPEPTLPQLQNPDDNADETENDETASNLRFLPRQVLKDMLAYQERNILYLPQNLDVYHSYFDNFSTQSIQHLATQYQVVLNDTFFKSINISLGLIATSILKSGIGNQYSEWAIHAALSFAFGRITGTTDETYEMYDYLISSKTQNMIEYLRTMVLHGSMAKATTSILFVDEELAITMADVEEAISDVESDEFMHDLLTSTVDETEGDNASQT